MGSEGSCLEFRVRDKSVRVRYSPFFVNTKVLKCLKKTNVMDKNNSIENEKRTSYVSRSHKSMVEFVATIYKSLGRTEYHSNKAIAAIHQLSPASIKQQLTSCQQYRLLEIKFGTGYKVTELFNRIYLPINDSEKRAAVVESLKSPDTYQQLFKEYEYHIVPPVSGIKNHFVRNFQYKDDIAEMAAETFIENLHDYNLLDNRGVLISAMAVKSNTNTANNENDNKAEIKPQELPTPSNSAPEPVKPDDGLFELPIPLPNRRKAYLRYPLENLTKKDIKVITKALEFIASSLDDENE